MVGMKQKGWRKEPARHYLASLGVKTRQIFHKPQISNKNQVGLIAPKLQCALNSAHALGYELGNSGLSDNEAELKASDEIDDLCSNVATSNSTMWNNFWRGWREGSHEYQAREWWT